ncbi:MAG: hypothetical protein H6Q69_800 [Firmicutes bacterium]|nr:hypothetical protein [Bacillota bacterium]
MEVPEFLFNLNLSTDKLIDHITQITRWVRLSGSEEEAKSFAYLEEQLKNIGAIVTHMHHDAYISLPENAALVVGGTQFPCQTHSLVPSTSKEGVQAEIVYVSSGRDGLSKADIRGKIVMIDGRAVGEPVTLAQNMGASGMIFISSEHIYEMCLSTVWGSPTIDTVNQLPQIPVVSVTQDTGEGIKQLLAWDKSSAILKTVVRTEWCKIPILIAEVKSPAITDKFIMLSGHVDSWYYGATDNAAANSVMLEIGRLAADNVNKLRRNLRLVFFSGHSHGRYAGSTWYADNLWEDLHKNCYLNINADVLGCQGAEDVTRAVTMTEPRGVVIDVVKKITGANFIGKRYARHADQSFWGPGVSSTLASFSKQPAKVSHSGAFSRPLGGPADLGWWWHTPDDTLDKVDPANLLRDARIFAAIALHFCCSPIVPLDFRPTAEELVGILEDWQRQAGKLFDLQIPLQRAKRLQEDVERLYVNRPQDTGDQSAVRKFNTTLLKLERALVPLNYTQGKIFENDGAVSQPPMPALAKIKDLTTTNDADKQKFILVELVRRRNYVAHALEEAIEVIQEYFI